MQRNANMLKILKKCVFADFMGFFAKMQSPVCPPEMTFTPRVYLALDCILDSYKNCFIIFMLQKKILHREVSRCYQIVKSIIND